MREYRAHVGEFVRRVMYLDDEEFFLHDHSTMEDLHRGLDVSVYVSRTRLVYRVDISDIRPSYLWTIAKRIQERVLQPPPSRPTRDSILADFVTLPPAEGDDTLRIEDEGSVAS